MIIIKILTDLGFSFYSIYLLFTIISLVIMVFYVSYYVFLFTESRLLSKLVKIRKGTIMPEVLESEADPIGDLFLNNISKKVKVYPIILIIICSIFSVYGSKLNDASQRDFSEVNMTQLDVVDITLLSSRSFFQSEKQTNDLEYLGNKGDFYIFKFKDKVFSTENILKANIDTPVIIGKEVTAKGKTLSNVNYFAYSEIKIPKDLQTKKYLGELPKNIGVQIYKYK